MDRNGLTWYTENMSRGPKRKPLDEVTVNLGLKVLPKIKGEVKDIVTAAKKTAEGRVTEAWVAYKLFMRGLEAYRKDRKLVGPAPTSRKPRPVLDESNKKTLKEPKTEKGGDNRGQK